MLRFVAFLEHDDHFLYTIWSNGVCDFGSVVCGLFGLGGWSPIP